MKHGILAHPGACIHRARARFLELSENDPNVVVIDASQSLEAVTADITQALTRWLEQQ